MLGPDTLATPERRAALGGAAVDFCVGPAGDFADLAVAVAGGDQAERAALRGLQPRQVLTSLDQVLGPFDRLLGAGGA